MILPTGRGDLNGAPMGVCQIELVGAIVLGNAQVHQAFGAIKLGARLQLIKGSIDGRRARSVPGCAIVGTTQESLEAAASDRPCFAVDVDHQIGIGRARRGVKELSANGQQGENHSGTQDETRGATRERSVYC